MKISRKIKWVLFILIMITIIGVFWQKILDVFPGAQQKVYKGYYVISGQRPKTYQSKIAVLTFASPALRNKVMEYRVYVPQAYEEQSNRRFPVLYLLHGDPGNNLDWLVNTNLQAKLDGLISQNKLPPLLVVFPDGNGPKIPASMYVNATTADQRMDDYLAKDLVKDVDTRFRTLSERNSRAIGGNSSGGYAAANLGLRHNDTFGIILSHGGYFDNWHKILNKTLGNNPEELQKNSPMLYLPGANIDPQTYIFLSIGRSDIGSLVEENKNFDLLLTKKNIPHELSLPPGFHTWNAWNRGIVASLEYLGQHIATD